MAKDPKQVSPSPKKRPAGAKMLDDIGWLIGQAALPVPDFLFEKRKKEKRKK